MHRVAQWRPAGPAAATQPPHAVAHADSLQVVGRAEGNQPCEDKMTSPSHRSIIRRLALAAFALAVTAAPSARAQDLRVERLEIVEFGFYDSGKAKVTRSTPSAGSVTGTVDELADVKLMPEPPPKSAQVGIGFGVRFRSFGARNGERAMLRSVWKIPEPGIVNPTNHDTYRESVADFPTTIGTIHWRGYAFDNAWEVVPGTWTVEIWQGDRKLLEKSFEIK
jgi:hypothetical protein